MNNPLHQATQAYSNVIPKVLPHERVYNIQVGNKLFKLSGASLSSDSPSYFTEYFKKPENESKVLFMDRSPRVFEQIAAHLQGYYVHINDDDALNTCVILDAYYFGLRRLSEILTADYYFIRVGNVPFKIPRALFATPGNHPNYITMNDPLDLTDVSKLEVFQFLRPPPTRTAELPNRSAKLFADLIELLKGNSTVIQSEEHRCLLIKECRYYRFLELEQRILNVKFIQNPFNPACDDIIINVNDILPKCVYVPPALHKQEVAVQYQRPYILKEPKRNLVFQINSSGSNQPLYHMSLHLSKNYRLATAETRGPLTLKLKKLFRDIIHPDDFLSNGDDCMATFLVSLVDCFSVINGLEMKPSWTLDLMGVTQSDMSRSFKQLDVVDGFPMVPEEKEHEDSQQPTKKRKLTDDIKGDVYEFRILKSLWKLTLLNGHPKLICVSFEAVTDLASFNKNSVKFLD